ncbi:MAG TPA: hypothetical protein VFT05_17780 [Burkholderiaceae bacterium]|jgi:hypothetical protein|nr:hypothetical protein [Burkholderiaceae bacterium]
MRFLLLLCPAFFYLDRQMRQKFKTAESRKKQKKIEGRIEPCPQGPGTAHGVHRPAAAAEKTACPPSRYCCSQYPGITEAPFFDDGAGCVYHIHTVIAGGAVRAPPPGSFC